MTSKIWKGGYFFKMKHRSAIKLIQSNVFSMVISIIHIFVFIFILKKKGYFVKASLALLL